LATPLATMHECLRDTTFRVATLAALFASLVAAVYAAVQTEASPVVGLFLAGGPCLAVILWLHQDARRTGVGTVKDWGLFLYFAWPLIIPWYAFKTRGRSGWQLTLLLFCLIFAPQMTGMLVSYAIWHP
jgi:hypothetical protein